MNLEREIERLLVLPASGDFAVRNQVSLYAPAIVKYRDEKNDAATMLEDALR